MFFIYVQITLCKQRVNLLSAVKEKHYLSVACGLSLVLCWKEIINIGKERENRKIALSLLHGYVVLTKSSFILPTVVNIFYWNI